MSLSLFCFVRTCWVKCLTRNLYITLKRWLLRNSKRTRIWNKKQIVTGKKSSHHTLTSLIEVSIHNTQLHCLSSSIDNGTITRFVLSFLQTSKKPSSWKLWKRNKSLHFITNSSVHNRKLEENWAPKCLARIIPYHPKKNMNINLWFWLMTFAFSKEVVPSFHFYILAKIDWKVLKGWKNDNWEKVSPHISI